MVPACVVAGELPVGAEIVGFSSPAWKEGALGLFVVDNPCGAGVAIAAAVGCAIVGQSLCMSLSFDSCVRVEGAGGKVGLSDAIAENCWFFWGQAALL